MQRMYRERQLQAHDDQPYAFKTKRAATLPATPYPAVGLPSLTVWTSCVDAPRRGRPRKTGDCKPIAPYDRDPIRALPNVFDRVTGESVEPEQLKTYAEALAQYHLSCEDKFSNGQFVDRIT